MTFNQRYQQEDTWYGKAIVMGIFHTVMCQNEIRWSLKDTADYFECSIGLVSENIRLAKAIDNPKKDLLTCKSRVEALKKLE
jgi:hypothetical protein